MTFATYQNYSITNETVAEFNRNYGDYRNYRNALIKTSENRKSISRITTMNKVIASLIILFSSNVIATSDYGIKYIDINNNPESELCKDMKEVVKNGEWVIVDGNKERERLPARPLGTDKIVFHNDKIETFSFIRDGKITDFPWNYFLLDINNDGDLDFFTILTGGQGALGEASNMEIYRNNWLLMKQPIDKNQAFDVKAYIGTSLGGQLQVLRGEDIRLKAYFIYVFKWWGNNYLLLQRYGRDGSNEGDEKDKSFYIVAELKSDYQIITHCLYVNTLK